MKILMVTEVFPNHVMPVFGTFCLERARAMRDLADIRVIAAVPYFPEWKLLRRFEKWHAWSQVREHDQVEGIDVYHPRRVVIPKLGGPTNGLLYARALEKAARDLHEEYPFDVIDAHFVWPDGFAASFVARSLGVPLCITTHGTDMNLMPDFPTIRPLIRQTLQQADRVIAVSRSLANIAESVGAAPEKLRVIHNGVDIDKFKRVDREQARRELGLKREDKVLLSVGALIPRKGHEHLIDGLELLIRAGWQDLRLIIVGEGPSRQGLQQRIHERGLEASITLQGLVPHADLHKWLSAADVTCLTSSREGWPTVFFESWACGVPAVATAVHGAPEAICSARYGVLIQEQNPVQIAEALDRALRTEWDPQVLMSYAARNTWKQLSLEVYAELKAVVAEAGS